MDVLPVATIFKVVMPERSAMDLVIESLSVDVVSGDLVSLFMMNW